MRQPMTITFPGLKPDRLIEAEIRKRAEKLDALCPGIISCHVVADIPHRHRQRNNHESALISKCGVRKLR